MCAGVWTEYKLEQALNIEQKKYSQARLCLYNNIGMIHRRGNGHILMPAFLGTDVEIWSMSAFHCYLIRSQSLSQVCLNCTTSAYVFWNSLFRCIWIWTKRKVPVWYLESKMCTGPNTFFIRDYETGEPRVTPSRHKVLSFSIHNTFETEFLIFEISCFSLCMSGNIMFRLLLSASRTMQKYFHKEVHFLGQIIFLVSQSQF